MKTRALLIVVIVAIAVAALAQTPAPSVPKRALLEFSPISCLKAGELALLPVNLAPNTKGELRAYFRRINTTDWCSVEGINQGPLSRVVLPRFDMGDEIEYFFVLLEGRRVLARSPRIYRSRVMNECETPFARHVLRMAMHCGEDLGAIPQAVGAGYALDEEIIRGTPTYGSPDRPVPLPPQSRP